MLLSDVGLHGCESFLKVSMPLMGGKRRVSVNVYHYSGAGGTFYLLPPVGECVCTFG